MGCFKMKVGEKHAAAVRCKENHDQKSVVPAAEKRIILKLSTIQYSIGDTDLDCTRQT